MTSASTTDSTGDEQLPPSGRSSEDSTHSGGGFPNTATNPNMTSNAVNPNPPHSATHQATGPLSTTLTIPAHIYGPSLTILRDPTRSRGTSSPPPLSSFQPLPVSLPRLPPIPPLVVHQEQLYFDDGLGAPGRCPHERVWGGINDHSEERGRNLTDVEMDDFMVDLGELISKEYDAWIERCW